MIPLRSTFENTSVKGGQNISQRAPSPRFVLKSPPHVTSPVAQLPLYCCLLRAPHIYLRGDGGAGEPHPS